MNSNFINAVLPMMIEFISVYEALYDWQIFKSNYHLDSKIKQKIQREI